MIQREFNLLVWWKGLFLLLGLVSVLTACDFLQEDVLPNSDPSEDLLQFSKESFSVPANGSLVIDLSASVEASTPIEIAIANPPLNGSIEVLGDRLIEYIAGPDFAQKGDVFVVRVSRGRDTWDQDSVIINPADSNFCHDGASTYSLYGTDQDSLLVFYPPVERLVCLGGDSSFSTQIIAEPQIGQAYSNGSVIYYSPVLSGGNYQTKLVYQQCGDSQVCHTNVLNIRISGDSTGCQLSAFNDAQDYYLGIDSTLGIDVMLNDGLCDASDVELEVISQSMYGAFWVDNNQVFVNYGGNAQPGAYDSLTYKLSSPSLDQTVYATLFVHLVGSDSTGGGDSTGGDTLCQVFAQSDIFDLYMSDSVGSDSSALGDTVNVYFEVTGNDSYCDLSSLQVYIVEQPSIGSAYISDKGVVYIRPRDGNEADDSLRYGIMQGGTSSEASVTIRY